MTARLPFIGLTLLVAAGFAPAQQVADLKYQPPIAKPAYETGQGPRVAIDEAHHNFHTVDGRYKPFAEFLRRDGYRVEGFKSEFTPEKLKAIDVLVIANALNERNKSDWSLPTPSAFTKDEVSAVKAWVESGGSLFLIVDHMPFPGAAGDLAKAFGVTFSNGYAVAGHWTRGQPSTFDLKTGLKECAVTKGRAAGEAVTSIETFGGSAFTLPKGGTPILTFSEKSVSHETKKAPGITADAPRVDIAGWHQGAVLPVGKGRVAVFGEAAMFSAQRAGPDERPMGMNAPAAKQNHQLLLNILHWLTRVKGMGD